MTDQHDSKADAKAIEILKKNDRGGYTVPTARLYPYQWNWDSAFVALGFATFDRDRAWTELEYLLEGQWDNGMIPSILFRHNDPDYFPGPSVWQTQTARSPAPPMPSTGISQPPILATVLQSLVTTGDSEDLKRAEPLIEKVLHWHRWYQSERSLDGSDAVLTVHPWETGRDNCPDWELGLEAMSVDPELEPYTRKDTQHANPAQRPSKDQYDKFISIVKFARERHWDQTELTKDGPFLMADPGIHFILLRANRDLLHVARKLNMTGAVDELQQLVEQGDRASSYFWNPELEAFTARDVRSGKFSNGISNASALCFLADTGTELQREKTIKHLERIKQRVHYMMPSWDPEAEHFDEQRYWCGPVWPQMNYLISTGLYEQGYESMAGVIRDDMTSLIRKSGFFECFNPMDGSGCLGTDFSWTAAIWLAWASPNRQKLAA